jgi:beta-barrel assembly-enhancing protease
MRTTCAALAGLAGLVLVWGTTADASPRPSAAPQIGSIVKKATQLRDLQVTEAEEVKIGASVSEKVRARYGVVQDGDVHRYVTLVGTLLVKKSSRPDLPFTFIVLDTDGVNAFAAPGGFIHITRGALALMTSEAELAGVLSHEIVHVTEKHTIKAIQKGKMIQMGAEDTISNNPDIFNKLVDKASELVLAGFGRNEELESDHVGVALANAEGYAPAGLSDFLTRLTERNKSATAKQGLFASHPEMQERLDRIAKDIAAQKLTATATLADRYKATIKYTPKAQAEIAGVTDGAAGLAGGSTKTAGDTAEKKDEPKKKGFGLGSLMKPAGSEKKQAEVTGSVASRGVDTERNARGGSNPSLVVVKITAADLDAFRKQGNLK